MTWRPDTRDGRTRTVPPGDAELSLFYSGHAEPVAGTLNEYKSPPFSHLAIGCSRCHGDTAAHLASPGPGDHRQPPHCCRAQRETAYASSVTCWESPGYSTPESS